MLFSTLNNFIKKILVWDAHFNTIIMLLNIYVLFAMCGFKIMYIIDVCMNDA